MEVLNQRVVHPGNPDANVQAGARSRHPGGVHVLMVDGSTKFVSNEVDRGLWHVMHMRDAVEPDATVTAVVSVSARNVGGLRAAAPKTEEFANELVNSIGMRLVAIPAGEFTMGIADRGRTEPAEVPRHQVRITRAFHIGEAEVTQQQYQRVMGVNPSWHASGGGGADEVGGQDSSQWPVENVSWYETRDFCEKLSLLHGRSQRGTAVSTADRSGMGIRVPGEPGFQWLGFALAVKRRRGKRCASARTGFSVDDRPRGKRAA